MTEEQKQLLENWKDKCNIANDFQWNTEVLTIAMVDRLLKIQEQQTLERAKKVKTGNCHCDCNLCMDGQTVNHFIEN